MPSAFSMPELVIDGCFRGWWTELLIAAIDLAIESVAIESVVEPVRGKHDEGTALSACTLEAVQKLCASVKNAEESIKTLKDTLPGGVGGGKWGKVERKAESQSYRRALQQTTKVRGSAHPPPPAPPRTVEQPRSRRLSVQRHTSGR